MIALLAILVLATPDQTAADASWAALSAFAAAAPAEPEPPPGLRAPAGTPRHERARKVYAKGLAVWQAARRKHFEDLERRCAKHWTDHGDNHARETRDLWAGACFELGRYAEARAAWATLYRRGMRDVGPKLVAACRALGDFEAALKYGGPTPEALEEAGQVDRAISAARRAGRSKLAADWALIGKVYPALGKIPQFKGPALLLVDRTLPEPVRKALVASSVGKIPFFSFSDGRSAIYLVDSKGVVRAVNPRLDTLQHRIKQLLSTR